MESPSRRSVLKTLAGAAAWAGCARPASRARPGAIVDAHMHVWSDDPKEFPFAHPYTPTFKPPRAPGTAEALLEEMDASGT